MIVNQNYALSFSAITGSMLARVVRTALVRVFEILARSCTRDLSPPKRPNLI